MGISLRHHVLSLVAVFLMLLVGLLVGVGLSSEPELTRAIGNLTEDFQEVMSENEALSRSLRTQEQFGRAALPKLVRDRLEGQQIVVVITARPEDDPAVSGVVETLEAAGARVPYHLVCRRGFPDQAAEAYQADTESSPAERAAQAMAKGIVEADEDALWELKRRGLIRIRGRVPREMPSALVLLGGAQPGEMPLGEVIDRPLVEALTALGLTNIVGCEGDCASSYMEVYQQLQLSTVDNADLIRGRFSVVAALSGRPGHYGDLPSADQEFAAIQ